MVQRSGEDPLLPKEVAIALKAELEARCQWGVSPSDKSVHVDGIGPVGGRQSFRFGPPDQPISRSVLETCLRRFGLSDTGTADYLRGRLL